MQKAELENLVQEFDDVFKVQPGKTELGEHCIETGESLAVCLPPYRLPQAF